MRTWTLWLQKPFVKLFEGSEDAFLSLCAQNKVFMGIPILESIAFEHTAFFIVLAVIDDALDCFQICWHVLAKGYEAGHRV